MLSLVVTKVRATRNAPVPTAGNERPRVSSHRAASAPPRWTIQNTHQNGPASTSWYASRPWEAGDQKATLNSANSRARYTTTAAIVTCRSRRSGSAPTRAPSPARNVCTSSSTAAPEATAEARNRIGMRAVFQ